MCVYCLSTYLHERGKINGEKAMSLKASKEGCVRGFEGGKKRQIDVSI